MIVGYQGFSVNYLLNNPQVIKFDFEYVKKLYMTITIIEEILNEP